MRQIQIAVGQGYNAEEVVDAVIRAITPGSVFRSYLETYTELSLNKLKKLLRGHYGVKNTAELYQSLQPKKISTIIYHESSGS